MWPKRSLSRSDSRERSRGPRRNGLFARAEARGSLARDSAFHGALLDRDEQQWRAKPDLPARCDRPSASAPRPDEEFEPSPIRLAGFADGGSPARRARIRRLDGALHGDDERDVDVDAASEVVSRRPRASAWTGVVT